MAHCFIDMLMFRPLSLFMGLRYTKAEKENRFISFTAMISMVSLTLGVAVLITVLSVMNGFDKELKTRILGMVPQATVTSSEGVIADWQALSDEIKSDKRVVATAPFTQLQGMITASGRVSGVLVSGIVPAQEKQVSIIERYMTKGSLDSLAPQSFGIIMGESLASNMGLQIGDKVTLVLPEASASPAGVIPRFKRFDLVGTFAISPEIDSMMAYIDMADAGALLRLPDGAQGIRMRLNNIFDARAVASQAVNVRAGLQANDWTYTHGNLFGAIQMEKAMVGLLLFLIIIVAAFNIVSSLVMVVTDKKADIAILKTFGATPKLITQVFMVQGMVIGVIGTTLGTILGVLLALFVGDILSYINTALNLHLFDAYFINYLPSDLRLSDVLIVSGASFLLSFLMTIYPARRASRTRPAETLRYE